MHHRQKRRTETRESESSHHYAPHTKFRRPNSPFLCQSIRLDGVPLRRLPLTLPPPPPPRQSLFDDELIWHSSSLPSFPFLKRAHCRRIFTLLPPRLAVTNQKSQSHVDGCRGMRWRLREGEVGYSAMARSQKPCWPISSPNVTLLWLQCEEMTERLDLYHSLSALVSEHIRVSFAFPNKGSSPT